MGRGVGGVEEVAHGAGSYWPMSWNTASGDRKRLGKLVSLKRWRRRGSRFLLLMRRIDCHQTNPFVHVGKPLIMKLIKKLNLSHCFPPPVRALP